MGLWWRLTRKFRGRRGGRQKICVLLVFMTRRSVREVGLEHGFDHTGEAVVANVIDTVLIVVLHRCIVVNFAFTLALALGFTFNWALASTFAFARALANLPALFLADEPTGNLDEHTADVVLAYFLRLVRGEGSAALVATHNERLAAKMDRVVRLHEGRLA